MVKASSYDPAVKAASAGPFEPASEKGKTTHTRDRRFPVMEIFGPTIQGEGAMLGFQTMFIRFGGCDYRCTKCDSLHAVLPELVSANATKMTATEIANAVVMLNAQNGHCRWITFSGGNPVMHELSELVSILRQIGYYIAVETQGTLWRPWLLNCNHVTISPKGPGMGETFEPTKFDFMVHQLARHMVITPRQNWSVKVVIMDEEDIKFAKRILDDWGPVIGDRFYLSLGNPFPPDPLAPLNNEGLPTQTRDIRLPLLDHYVGLVDMILKDKELENCFVTPQLHVLFWGNKQGV